MTESHLTCRLHRRAGRTALLALALASATGCVSMRTPMKDPPTWPLPPDKPRIRFVRAFASENDLRTGFGMFLKRVFSPADPTMRPLQPTGLSLSADEK